MAREKPDKGTISGDEVGKERIPVLSLGLPGIVLSTFYATATTKGCHTLIHSTERAEIRLQNSTFSLPLAHLPVSASPLPVCLHSPSPLPLAVSVSPFLLLPPLALL